MGLHAGCKLECLISSGYDGFTGTVRPDRLALQLQLNVLLSRGSETFEACDTDLMSRSTRDRSTRVLAGFGFRLEAGI